MSTNFTILVVEDHEPEWQLYRDGLAPLQCECDFCRWGEEALQKAERRRYHLIFFDLGLPQGAEARKRQPMDDVAWGEHVFGELRKLHTGPIVVLTSHSDSYPGSPALERMRPDAFLAKVVLPEDILATAKRFLNMVS